MRSIVLLFALCSITPLFGQWTQQVNGMVDASVGALYADGATLYAGTSTEMYKSVDFGETWTGSSNGLPTQTNFYAIIRSGSHIVAGGDRPGIWRSADDGASWTQSTAGIAADRAVLAFALDGGKIFAACGSPPAVAVSTDDGATWTQHSNGMTETGFITGIAVLGGDLFALHDALGVYRSTDAGYSWSLVTPVPAQTKMALIASGDALIVVTIGGVPSQNAIHYSTDKGGTWTRARSGSRMTGLSRFGGMLFAVGDTVFTSTDDGRNWTPLSVDGLPGTAVWNTLQVAGSYAFVNFLGVGVYRHATNGLIASVVSRDARTLDGFGLEGNRPNPFDGKTILRYRLPAAGRATLRVYDLLAREVDVLFDGEQESGEGTVEWNASGLENGIYIARLTAGDRLVTRTLLLRR